MEKRPYFTTQNITKTSMSMLSELQKEISIRRMVLDPRRSALLVLDMQAVFLHAASHAFVPSAPAILPGINALIRAYSGRNYPVFLTSHINTIEDAGLMANWWHNLICAEDPRSGLDPRLERGNGIEITKSHYDAFFDTPLEARLQEAGVHQVVICGVMTHLCVETTARSAFMRGIEVFLPVDGTATYTKAFHRGSLLNLAHGFATPVLIKGVLLALEAHA